MPAPPTSPEAGERRSPPADFEWPPRDELSIHEIRPADRADHWQRPQDGAGQGSDDSPTRVGEPGRRDASTHGARHRAWRRTRRAGAITAAAFAAAGAGWGLYRHVTAPIPAEAAPPPTVTVVPAPPATGAVLSPGPTIRLTYPVDSPPDRGEPGEARTARGLEPPWPEASGVAPSDTTAVFEAVGDGVSPRTRVTDVPAVPGEGLASPAAAIVAAPGVPAPSPVAAVAPAALIRSTLARYENAYDRGDVDAAATVWPSLDRRALSKAFASLDRQDVDFERCAVHVDGGRGSAVCDGILRYVPGVGSGVEKSSRITWTFDLTRSGDEWQISSLQAR